MGGSGSGPGGPGLVGLCEGNRCIVGDLFRSGCCQAKTIGGLNTREQRTGSSCRDSDPRPSPRDPGQGVEGSAGLGERHQDRLAGGKHVEELV